jgi:catechol 2,3-dioxygenase-like lactoylglutathione lyase family enzyme
VFDHVTIRVSHRPAAERLYEAVLRTLLVGKDHPGEHYAEWDMFSMAQATDEKPATRNLHIGFAAPSRAHVEEFWRAGTEAGLRDDGRPGPRPEYRDDYYGSFLRDADGNSVEAVHHGAMRGGLVDHLWIRVPDVAAAKRFYETISPHAGIRLDADEGELVRFVGEGGSFSLVAGMPTENLHMAFPAAEDAVVQAFHRAATEAGYRDNGAPGERPIYHPGYYSAFVLDPAGNNIEVVNHHRG